jgi:hypothetical protein
VSLREKLLWGAGGLAALWILFLILRSVSGRPRSESGGWAWDALGALLEALFWFL